MKTLMRGRNIISVSCFIGDKKRILLSLRKLHPPLFLPLLDLHR